MFTSSEDAMIANCRISYQVAAREMRNHGMTVQEPTSKAFEGYIFAKTCEADEFEPVALTTRAVLEWLGY